MNATATATATAGTTAGPAKLVRLRDTRLTVADPAEDVRSQKVFDKKGREIGEVADLLLDGSENKVRFLQVASGGFLGMGETTFLIPVDAVATIQEEGVYIDREREHVAAAPRYNPDLLEEDPYTDVYGHYGYMPFWGAGYVYPRFPFYF